METDNLFYRIFLRNPQLISELLPQIPVDCQFQMSAPVVKGRKFSLDGLLTPLDENPEHPLIFLEAQMQRDLQFYGRYFAEIFSGHKRFVKSKAPEPLRLKPFGREKFTT